MKLIGTKFFTHDSAVCTIDTKRKTVTALSTERLTRIKHDDLDASRVLKQLGVEVADAVAHAYSDFSAPAGETGVSVLQVIRNEVSLQRRALYRPKYLKELLSRGGLKDWSVYLRSPLRASYLGLLRLANKVVPGNLEWLNQWSVTNYIKHQLGQVGVNVAALHFYDHHDCHAASAAVLAPFGAGSFLNVTMDGYGDGYFSKAYWFEGASSKLIAGSKSVCVAGRVMSLGQLYGDVTEAAGYHRNADEGKVEALAAFASQDKGLREVFERAIQLEGCEWIINTDPYAQVSVDFLRKQIEVLGPKVVAATIQRKLEDDMVAYINALLEKHPKANLALSGGVAANIIMSLALYERCDLGELFVCPPMSDDGLALGSAVLLAQEYGEDVSWIREHRMPYFGTVVTEIDEAAARHAVEEIPVDNWEEDCAEALSQGAVVGVVQGRMEYGPRALGNRSILANPLLPDTRDRINSTVKRRPLFQPFCPSILESERERLFEKSFAHKHMAIAFRMKKEFHESLPCAVHVDGTARPQFVEAADNEGLFNILTAFKERTGFGVLINTSFNLHGRTIVQSADDVFTDFIDCQLDVVYVNGRKFVRAN